MKVRVLFLTMLLSTLLAACVWGSTLAQVKETPAEVLELTSTPDELARLSSLYPCIAGKTRLEHATLLKVIDGDSILVEMDGREYEVRYIGIDAPEFEGATWVAAEQSAGVNRSLLLSKQLTMVRDVSETDRYDRLLRYVFAGDVFVNYELVRQGAAEAKAYRPDTTCQGLLSQGIP